MHAEHPTYDLFISYVRRDARLKIGRRRVDLVDLFKRELEGHARPKDLDGPSRFVACTDVDDFELGRTFNEVMSDRIERSRRFLLVCSPNVSSSEYVLREIELFRQLKAGQRPVAAILGAKPSALLPDLFSDRDVAADLTQHDDATMRDVRSALRRESHKIVAQVWGISPRDVFDRFEARRQSLRRRIAAAAILALLVFVGLVLGLGGEVGYHRVAELIPPTRLVSPAGVGFSADGSTPVVIRDRAAYLWSRPGTGPEKLDLSIYALRAVQDRPGRMAIVDVNEFAVVDLSTGGTSSSRAIPGETAGIASWKGTAAISNKNGNEPDIEGVVGIRLLHPPLRAPVLAQHTLGYVFSASPTDRAAYFRAVLDIQDLEDFRAAVAGLADEIPEPAAPELTDLAAVELISELADEVAALVAAKDEGALKQALDTVVQTLLGVIGVTPRSSPQERIDQLAEALESRRKLAFPLTLFSRKPLAGWTDPSEALTGVTATFAAERNAVDAETRRLVSLFESTLSIPAIAQCKDPIDCPVCGTAGALTPERVTHIRDQIAANKAYQDAEKALAPRASGRR